MALSNAERQRRYRQRRKQQIEELQVEIGDIPAVARPNDANGSKLEELPRHLQALYGAIDHIHDTCRIAKNIDTAGATAKDDTEHREYLRFRLAKAERHLRHLRKKLRQSRDGGTRRPPREA